MHVNYCPTVYCIPQTTLTCAHRILSIPPQTPPPPLNLLLPSPYHQSLSIYTMGLTSATSIHVCPSHTSLTRFLLLVSGLHDLSQSLLYVIKFRFHNRNTICKPKYVLNFHLFNKYSLGTYCGRV